MRRKKEIKYFTEQNTASKDEQSVNDFLAAYIDVDGNDEQSFLNDSGTALDDEMEQLLLDNIHQGILVEQRRARRRRVISLASVSLVIAVFVVLLMNGNRDEQVFQTRDNIEENITLTNTSTDNQVVALPDGSIVLLFPRSTIVYHKNFEAKYRDIHLTGKAKFTVAKDPTRPFSVYSHQLKTTALGTVFSVEESKDSINVRLYEGKILVGKASAEDGNKYYLSQQGTEIAYCINQNTFTPIWSLLTSNPKNKTQKYKQPASVTAKSNTISFENIPMEVALEKLAQKYHVEITYSESDLRNINIIATLGLHQPIEKILGDIAQMNSLRLRKISDREFEISR
ncbi:MULTISPECIES: FecR family protein [Chitinophagaceae]